MNTIQDQAAWDYLLYLETTQAGQVVHRFMPSTTKTILNFKIDFLAAALSQKPVFLQMPQEDLTAALDMLHHISGKHAIHTLELTNREKYNEIAIQLFGINKHIDTQPLALLEQLKTGTLYIHNIHLLSLPTQYLLVNFLTYGFYRNLKSDYKLFSNTRLICSTTENIKAMAHQGTFCPELYKLLSDNALLMPSLITLGRQEFKELLDALCDQTLKNKAFKPILQLSAHEKDKILDNRPASIFELKDKIQQIMVLKATKHNLYTSELLDIAYNINDPAIAQAARLGKKALQDPGIMQLLWQRFKNQTKIALVLGVNRSSVNRRFKEYDFTEH